LGSFDDEETAAKLYAKAAYKIKPKKIDAVAARLRDMGLDLSDVPEQPPILKADAGKLHVDHTRKNQDVKPNSSKYVGVSLSGGKWRAKIYHPGRKKEIGLGSFDDEETAAKLYAKVAYKIKKIDAASRDIVFYGVNLMTEVSDQPLLLSQAEHAICKYKGVCMRRRRYEARIRVGKKNKNLGVYDTQEEAAKVYAKAAYVLNRHQQKIF